MKVGEKSLSFFLSFFFAQSMAGQRNVGSVARASARTRIQPRRQSALNAGDARPRQTRVGLQTNGAPNSRGQYGSRASADMEVIILVRSKSNPSISDTITVQNPGPKLLDYLGQMNASTTDSRQLDIAQLRQRVESPR